MLTNLGLMESHQIARPDALSIVIVVVLVVVVLVVVCSTSSSIALVSSILEDPTLTLTSYS